ncbi:alpha-L-arabinofuranosidase B [Actinacidiphila rubida]|uniref:Alpha-L-arabinofuranosidase B (ABFB) domain-containing protein n=1 Tax=Actinacidiphila rubida TaxID=310780 RepID=A0A1H8UVK8_9ACTN|nr:alpha-L-arabinofuranosidase B [Actinacidiphila rubida]SEP07023.1 Alpha-L-arabinofuranosidase B (ABFB) domain-containing protein [Actinacidiphila rubida]
MSSSPTARLVRRLRTWALSAAAATVLVAGVLAGAAAPAPAAGSLPCDIYASGGTPCVAAHSTTRALYSAYNGPLYQVRRASDNSTRDIGLLSSGGYANAATQDSFCAGTTCVITVIYDQSGRGNNLTQAPGGGAAGGPDNLANATSAPTTVGGHKAYGVFVAPGTGYRDDHTSGIATGDQSEGMYAILDGTHYNGGCCFDYGNAETSNNDTGNGHMEAIYFGNIKVWGYGAGNGPWVMADLENGLFSGVDQHYNANDPTVNHRYLTAMVKGGANQWAIRGGDAQSGGLSTFYSGVRPNVSGYNPMHKEGAIILGIGGDNSKGSAGTFYEGAMTSGYPSDATENAVQADIASVGYATTSTGTGGLTPGQRLSLRATTACCTSDYLRHDDADSNVAISAISSSSSATDKGDATWIVRAGLSNSACVSFESGNDAGQYLRHSNFQLRLNANDGSSQFAQDATFCPQAGNNGQGLSFPAVNYPDHFIRHYGYTVYLATDGGSNAWDSATSWSDDTSWAVAQPWA